MTVIERAARALAELEGANWNARNFGETPSGQDPEDMRQGYRDQARAVLQAIREPSDKVLEDGAGCLWAGSRQKAEAKATEVWQAMIDAALTE